MGPSAVPARRITRRCASVTARTRSFQPKTLVILSFLVTLAAWSPSAVPFASAVSHRNLAKDYLTSADDFDDLTLRTPVVLEVYETSGDLSVYATNELAFGLARFLYFEIRNSLRIDQDMRDEFELLLGAIPELNQLSCVLLANTNASMPFVADEGLARRQRRAQRRLQDQQSNKPATIVGSRLEFQVSIKWAPEADNGPNSIDGGAGDSDGVVDSLFQSLVEQALQGDVSHINGTSTMATSSEKLRQPSQSLMSNLTLSSMDELSRLTSVLYFPPTSAPTSSPVTEPSPTPAPTPVSPPTATVTGANRDVPSLAGDKSSARLWPAVIVAAGVFVVTSFWIAFGRRQGVNLDDLESIQTDDDGGFRDSKLRRSRAIDDSRRQGFQEQERIHSFVLRNTVSGSEPEPLPYTKAAVAAAAAAVTQTNDSQRNKKAKKEETDHNVAIPSVRDMVRMPDGTHIHHSHPSTSDEHSNRKRYSGNVATSTLPPHMIATGYRTSPMPLEEASDFDSDSHQSSVHSDGRWNSNFNISDGLTYQSSANGVSPTTARWEQEWSRMGGAPAEEPAASSAANNNSNRSGAMSPAALGDDISNYSSDASSNDALLAPAHNGTGLFCPYTGSVSILSGDRNASRGNSNSDEGGASRAPV